MIRFTRQELADLHYAATFAVIGIEPRNATPARKKRIHDLCRRLAELRAIKRGKARRAKELRNA